MVRPEYLSDTVQVRVNSDPATYTLLSDIVISVAIGLEGTIYI